MRVNCIIYILFFLLKVSEEELTGLTLGLVQDGQDGDDPHLAVIIETSKPAP